MLQLKHDLDVLGIPYDEDGIGLPEYGPPGLMEYFKRNYAAFFKN